MKRKIHLGPMLIIISLAFLASCTMSTELLGQTRTPAPTAPRSEPQPTVTLIPTRFTVAMDEILATAVPQDPNRPLRLVLVQHARCAWDSFWCTVEQGINEAAARLNIAVTIIGPDEYDLEATATLIDQAIAMEPDGIGVTLSDPGLFAEPIRRANEAGIPVMAYNAGSGPDKDGLPYFGYLGQDDYQSGHLSGTRLVEAGGTAGVCISESIGSPNFDRRCRGFVDSFRGYGQTVEVLPIPNEENEAAQIIGAYFAEHPEVNAALTLGGSAARAYYAYLEQSGRGPDSIVHGTFDLTAETRTAILAGRTIFGVDQQPYLQGYGVVYWLSLIARLGIRPAAPTLATGPGFIDIDSLSFAPDPTRPLQIIAVQHARCDWDPFWCVVENGIQRAAIDLGISITILGPDSFDLAAMSRLIDEAIAREPDALMVTIPDARALEEAIEAAAKAGIPIIAYNAGNGPILDDLPYLTYLGQDEYQSGSDAAARLIDAGATYGVCINHQPGNQNMDARCEGMIAGFKGADLPSDLLEVSTDPVFTQGILEGYFSANRDVDAALTLGPAGAEPLYLYFATSGRRDIWHGTFDLSSQIVARIREGVTLFAIDQQPYLQGYGSVTTINLLLRHGVVPVLPVTPTGPGFIDLQNVELVKALAGEFR